jgi:hypothetical protein
VPFCASLTALGFAACTGAVATGASSSSGGAGGSGETSSSSAASGTPSSGSTMPEAGPLTCKGSYTNIPIGECDLLAQDCGPGRTCRPVLKGATWTTTCINAPGIKSEAEVCYTATECRGGLHCIAGRCAPFCCPTSGEPCLGGVCGFTVEYGQGGVATVRACRYSQQCEVLVPDACPTGYDCHIDDFDFGLATCVARSIHPVDEYQVCMFANDCDDMQQCRNAAPYLAGNRCLTLCYATGPKATNPKGLGGCDPGASCVFEGTLGLEGVGLCVPKMGIPDAGGGG